MLFNLTGIILVIVIFQLLFTTVFLYTHPKGYRPGNILLGALTLSMAIGLADGLLWTTGVFDTYPQLAFWGNNFSWLYGPLFYLYTLSVVYSGFKLRKIHFWHGLPFYLIFTAYLFIYHIKPFESKAVIWNMVRTNDYDPTLLIIALGAIYLQLFAYILLSLKELSKYRMVVKQKFSTLDKINLRWLSHTLLGFLAVSTGALFHSIVQYTPPFRGFYELSLAVLILLMFFFINKIVLQALRQPEIFAGISRDDPSQVHKYATSSLKPEENQRLLDQLKTCILEEKPYLEPDLTIDQLAEKMSVSTKWLSQVINQNFQQSFFDFVNFHRIEEAMRLLHRPEDPKITVQEVMYRVGFNSKSSFNTAFKKFAGATPGEYKRAHV